MRRRFDDIIFAITPDAVSGFMPPLLFTRHYAPPDDAATLSCQRDELHALIHERYATMLMIFADALMPL